MLAMKSLALSAALTVGAVSPGLAQQPLAPPELTSGAFTSFTGAWFGAAIAIDGDRALVSAPITEFGTSLTGSAWAFAWNGTGWSVEQHLDAPGSWSYLDFGHAADLDGDVAVIGAPSLNGYTGGAVIYEHDGAAWVQTAVLPAPLAP